MKLPPHSHNNSLTHRILLAIVLALLVMHITRNQAHAAPPWRQTQPTPAQRQYNEQQRQYYEDQRETLRLQNELLDQTIRQNDQRERFMRAYVDCMQFVYPSAEDYGVQELECRRRAMEFGTP